MGRRKNIRTQFGDSVENFLRAYHLYLNILTEIAISSFTYENLPKTVNPRYIELALFGDGKGVWFEDDVVGMLALNCVNKGRFDVYGESINRRAYSKYNHYQVELTNKNSVIMWNNMLRTNSVDVVDYYARKFAEIDCTIAVNVRGQKTPVLLQGTEQQRMTLINMYKEYDGNSPLICATDGLDVTNAIKSIPTVAPYVSDKLTELRKELWEQCMSYLGISTQENKRERLLRNEILMNESQAFANRRSRLGERKRAVEKINEMFGTDIRVEYNSIDMDSRITDALTEGLERGEDYGEVHDTVENDSGSGER